jgi:pimeloyl-ACP methyl ester carboxylesterase
VHRTGPDDADRVLVLLPGFMSSPSSYAALVAPVASAGVLVVVPALYPRGIAALGGRHTVEQEADDAAQLVRGLATGGRGVVLAGHSRGGQAAWRAANALAADSMPTALVLIDPVDGAGRQPSQRSATRVEAAFSTPAWVVGAALGGRCAPPAVNHRAFAEATPHARHVVVEDLGHADVLDGRSRALGRRLCGGASDPDPGRALVSALLLAAVDGDDVTSVPDPRGLLRVVR